MTPAITNSAAAEHGRHADDHRRQKAARLQRPLRGRRRRAERRPQREVTCDEGDRPAGFAAAAVQGPKDRHHRHGGGKHHGRHHDRPHDEHGEPVRRRPIGHRHRQLGRRAVHVGRAPIEQEPAGERGKPDDQSARRLRADRVREDCWPSQSQTWRGASAKKALPLVRPVDRRVMAVSSGIVPMQPIVSIGAARARTPPAPASKD